MILLAALTAGAMAAATGSAGWHFPLQVQMPQQSIPGQTRTAPGRNYPAAKPAAPAAKAAAPAQGVSSPQDKQIEATIRAKLAKSKIGKDGFTVRVQGGVAYWEGSTSVVQHKGSATRMAKSAGAKAVINNIKISDAAKQKAAENLDQGRRRAQVKRSDPRTQP